MWSTIILVFYVSSVSSEIVNIGAIFEEHYEYLQWAFRLAVDQVNRNNSILPNMKLRASIDIVKKNDGFFSAKKACEMVSQGVVAIFGPQSVRTIAAVQAVTESAGVPLIINRWEYRTKPSNTTVFLYPHAETKGFALRDFIQLKSWKTFAVIYQDPKALIRLSAVLAGNKIEEDKDLNITIKQLEEPEQLKKIFKETKKMNIKNYLIDIKTTDVIWALEQAKEMDMMNIYHNYFFTSLDVHTQDFKQFKGIYSNITMFQVVDTNHYQYKLIVKELETGIVHIGLKERIKPYLNTTQFALMYDAVFHFAMGITKLGPYFHPTIVPHSCYSQDTWAQGKIIIDAMKATHYDGLTGVINLDENGFRTDFNLLEIRVVWGKLNLEGNWNKTHKFTVIKKDDLEESEAVLSKLHLRVSAIESEPYFQIIKNSTNDQMIFQGHSIDLVEELAKIANFTYSFKPVADGQYGTFENGEWNGMVGELIRNEADMAVADLSVTQERQSAVDFTAPYMNLGVGILFKKPSKKKDNLFSFLSPFSVQVWFYMATAILGVTIVMYVMGRFTPYEWKNPHPCNPKSETLENQFTLQETAWLVVGCVMQGGGDIDPKATSTRMAIGYWWFFTLIMVSSYTANLAAVLTTGRLEQTIKSAEDLVNHAKVQYGCLKGGSTEKFFKQSTHPTYSRMWTVMESAEPKVFVSSNVEGKERVKKGNYAFFMESTSIDYAIATDCELIKIGDSLDEKSYAIAIPKGSPIRESLSHALLKLQEQGITKLLKRRWWKSKRECPKVPPPSDTLGVESIGGVFLILTIGLPLASIIVLVEFYWRKRKIPREERKPICIELCKELKATIMGKNTIKTVPPEPEDEERIILSNPISSSLTSTSTEKSTATKKVSLCE